MIRAKNIAKGSSVSEHFVKQDREATTGDLKQLFIFPGAKKIELVELGIFAGGTFTGTGVNAKFDALTATIDETDDPIQTANAGKTILHDHNGTVYELAAEGVISERADDGQVLATLDDEDTFGQYIPTVAGAKRGLGFFLSSAKDTVSAFDGYAFARIRVHYEGDL